METLLIFGGSGCLGRHLIRRYLGKCSIVNFSRDEHKHWCIDQEFGKGIVHHVVGDAKDDILVKQTLLRFKPTRIYLLHALKHVDRCQENVHACINTNLLSIKNVLDCIQELHLQLPQLKNVCFTSTDKAASPVNAYGMCKALSEELIIDKARYLMDIKFVVVRYGNVVNSTCSLLPSLMKNTSCTYHITDDAMTRFWMTIDQACDTIDYACHSGESGEVIIPKVKSFFVKDLISYVAKLKGKVITKIGLRPGERLYETLINDSQSMRTYEKNGYYHIKPYYNPPTPLTPPFTYDSTTHTITDQAELLDLFNTIVHQPDHDAPHGAIRPLTPNSGMIWNTSSSNVV